MVRFRWAGTIKLDQDFPNTTTAKPGGFVAKNYEQDMFSNIS